MGLAWDIYCMTHILSEFICYLGSIDYYYFPYPCPFIYHRLYHYILFHPSRRQISLNPIRDHRYPFPDYTHKYPTIAKNTIPIILPAVFFSSFPAPLVDVEVVLALASCAVNEVNTFPSLAVITTITCAVVVLFPDELLVVGVVLLVEKVVNDEELDELEVELDVELDVVDEETVLLELDVVVELLSVLEEVKMDDVVGVNVVVVVGVAVVVVGVVEVVLREMVEVLDLEVLVELFVLDIKVLNLGSPLDKLKVTTTVLVASSRHQLHSQEILFQKHGDQGIFTRRRPLPTNKSQNPKKQYQKPYKHPHLTNQPKSNSSQSSILSKQSQNPAKSQGSRPNHQANLAKTNPARSSTKI